MAFPKGKRSSSSHFFQKRKVYIVLGRGIINSPNISCKIGCKQKTIQRPAHFLWGRFRVRFRTTNPGPQRPNFSWSPSSVNPWLNDDDDDDDDCSTARRRRTRSGNIFFLWENGLVHVFVIWPDLQWKMAETEPTFDGVNVGIGSWKYLLPA